MTSNMSLESMMIQVGNLPKEMNACVSYPSEQWFCFNFDDDGYCYHIEICNHEDLKYVRAIRNIPGLVVYRQTYTDIQESSSIQEIISRVIYNFENI